MNATERTCGICGRIKPAADFSEHYSYCKACDAVYGGTWDASGHEHEWPARLRQEPYRTMVRWAADVAATSQQLRELGKRLARAGQEASE